MSRYALPLALVVLCASNVSLAYGQSAINMSHDLVTLGIAAQNLTPDIPSLDATPLFQAAINYAGANHVPYVTLDHGAYYFLSTSTPGHAYINIGGITDVTVDLAGSTVWFSDALTSGFILSDCARVTFENFDVDYLTPPYTHVQLTSVDAAGGRLLYSTLPNWQDPALLNNLTGSQGLQGIWAIAFRNGDIVPGTSRMAVVKPMSAGVLTLLQDGKPWTQPGTLNTLRPGDIIVVTFRGLSGPPVGVWTGDSIVLTNITIYASTGFGIILSSVSNSLVDHVSVMTRPGSDRLVASDEDGIHIVNAFANNTIRNCYVTRTADDGIIIDAQGLAEVVEQLGPRQIRVTRSAYGRFPNGLLVNFVDPVSAT
jgi:hypothetical protein